jgi:ketol-acid reductoisomerase
MRVNRTASLQPLTSKKIAILGYGSQGRAQALNLRDAGFTPVIGLPPRSTSRRVARADHLQVVVPSKAVANSDVILVLAPDHLHGVLYKTDIEPNLHPGLTLAFAHASSVHFGLVKPPGFVDVILVAPLGPGKRLRELRGRSDGVPCFWAVHQCASRRARRMALALAHGIGCLPAGAIETTFADEAVGDLFGEQAVLCGGLGQLLEAGVSTLVRHGLNPDDAYLECVYQLDLIVDLIKTEGLAGMYRLISPTASYGARMAGPRIIGKEARRAMDRLYNEIASGKFFSNWAKHGSVSKSRREIAPPVSAVFARGEREVLNSLGSRRPKR